MLCWSLEADSRSRVQRQSAEAFALLCMCGEWRFGGQVKHDGRLACRQWLLTVAMQTGTDNERLETEAGEDRY